MKRWKDYCKRYQAFSMDTHQNGRWRAEEERLTTHEINHPECAMLPTLLFSVATVARMLFADRRTIFSLVNPKNAARG